MENNIKPQLPKSRMVLGISIFIIGFLTPLLIPLVTKSNLPVAWKTALSGLLAFGIPELFMIITVAVLGKEGYQYLKYKVLNFLKQYGPPKVVSKARYRLGLVFFIIPLLVGWLYPYFDSHVSHVIRNDIYINIGGDIMLFLSFFILGGEFWDKIRALFIYKKTIK